METDQMRRSKPEVQVPPLAIHPPYNDYAHATEEWIVQQMYGDRSHLSNRLHDIATGTKRLFPVKLHTMLEEVSHSSLASIVGWLPHGRAFKVHDKKRFVAEIMPQYFRTQTQYESFQRQCIYGFTQLTGANSAMKGTCYHVFCLRGRSTLCRLIDQPVPTMGRVRRSFDASSEPNFDRMPPLPLYRGALQQNDALEVAPADPSLPVRHAVDTALSTPHNASQAEQPSFDSLSDWTLEYERSTRGCAAAATASEMATPQGTADVDSSFLLDTHSLLHGYSRVHAHQTATRSDASVSQSPQSSTHSPGIFHFVPMPHKAPIVENFGAPRMEPMSWPTCPPFPHVSESNVSRCDGVDDTMKPVHVADSQGHSQHGAFLEPNQSNQLKKHGLDSVPQYLGVWHSKADPSTALAGEEEADDDSSKQPAREIEPVVVVQPNPIIHVRAPSPRTPSGNEGVTRPTLPLSIAESAQPLTLGSDEPPVLGDIDLGLSDDCDSDIASLLSTPTVKPNLRR